jgi:hypothetical protein
VRGGCWRPRLGPRAARTSGTFARCRRAASTFSARHYSYFYVPGPAPRPRFVDGNRPTDAERAGTFATFIAGAGTYTFVGRTLALRADFRKNPNEMTGEVWHWELDLVRGDTLRFVFREPPFLPGRVWRTTLVRAD